LCLILLMLKFIIIIQNLWKEFIIVLIVKPNQNIKGIKLLNVLDVKNRLVTNAVL